MDEKRPKLAAPRGTTLRCKGWVQEAALRMLLNNLDPEVAEDPDNLVVYGGSGKAARNWDAFNNNIPSVNLAKKIGFSRFGNSYDFLTINKKD